ncbi:cyclase family protein [Oceanivirga salmonicida]|uniref:cyclase family protein n=1 Tax=Oceanivirga salmonicida TaxID=1769291 RepID=UPI000831BFF9|nr:cyclase family protein [Oceanivirga salmonicida]
MDLKLWDELNRWRNECKFIDLTHELSPETTHWSGFKPMDISTKFNLKEHGFYVNEFTLVGQYGTHVDAPGHFVEGNRLLDKLVPDEMILPLCVVDISDIVKNDPDYSVKLEDFKKWEDKYDKIPENSFVALRTDWSKKDDLDNCDSEGNKHYPGWSMEVLKFLVEERNIKAIGHETSDTDPAVNGAKDGLIMEYYILEQDRYEIELLKNLSELPPKGSLIFCGFPKGKDFAGFPARCIAICPK